MINRHVPIQTYRIIEFKDNKLLPSYAGIFAPIMQAHLVHEFSSHEGGIYDLCSFGGDTILSASADRFVASWDLKQRAASGFAIKLKEAAYALHQLKHSKKVIVGTASGKIHYLDALQHKELRLLDYHKKGVFGFVELASQYQVLSLGGDGTLAVWQSDTMDFVRGFPLSDHKLRGACLLPNGRLAIGAGNGQIHILDSEFLNEVATLEGHTGGVNCLAFHQKKSVLISGGRDAHLRFWDSASWKQVRNIPAHNFAIYDIVFNEDQSLCATASFDKTLKIWSTHDFEKPLRLDHHNSGHRASVNALLWHESGVLCSAGDDKKIKLWKVLHD
jgi:WD40 repeat protein